MLYLLLSSATAALTLSTRTVVPSSTAPAALHDFLATPTNWPKIVLSSWSVEGASVDEDRPLAEGESVDEIFGAPPVLPLSVRWTCEQSDKERGILKFKSPAGLEGVASDCKMEFEITPGADGTALELLMSYEPVSPLAVVASPVLVADNAFALKVLLPRALAPSNLGTMDPIAGPLVGAARALGLMAKEEDDGWRGEPSAWADADSLTQRLSAFSQSRLSGVKQFLADRVAGEYDEPAVRSRLDGYVSDHAVVVFSFTSCPFCKKAKELLEAKGASFEVVELDEDGEGAAMRAQLGRRTGRTSVPSVFIGGEYIGGMNDGSPGLGPLEAAGALEDKLRAAGALA